MTVATVAGPHLKATSPKNQKTCASVSPSVGLSMRRLYRVKRTAERFSTRLRCRTFHVRTYRKKTFLRAMRPDELESYRELFAFTLHPSRRDRDAGHAREVRRHGEDIFGVHGERIARFFTYLEGGVG